MLNSLIIGETLKTPFVRFDQKEGLLEIKGRSISEDSFKFYNPLLAWVDDYRKEPNDFTKVSISLEYFNSSSAKRLYSFLKRITTLSDESHKVEISWHFDKDDEDMMNTGKDFETLLAFPIKMVSNPYND
jgi:hypothetical protein